MGEAHLSPLMTFGSHFTVALDLDSRVIGFKETLLIRNTKKKRGMNLNDTTLKLVQLFRVPL